MSTHMKKSIHLILWIAGLLLISSGIGDLTQSNMEPWYSSLNKSPLTPPGYVFGIAWTILYTLIAISGWALWRQDALPNQRSLKTTYIIQLALNWAWTPLFFYWHLTGPALLCLIALLFVVTLLVFQSSRRLRTVSYLLAPYLLWLAFAFYLNLYIFLFNH